HRRRHRRTRAQPGAGVRAAARPGRSHDLHGRRRRHRPRAGRSRDLRRYQPRVRRCDDRPDRAVPDGEPGRPAALRGRDLGSGRPWPDMVELPDLGALVDLAVGAGFRPLYIEAASGDEWDAFESGFLADSEEWLLTHPGHADAATVRAEADEHRDRWLHGYRGG